MIRKASFFYCLFFTVMIFCSSCNRDLVYEENTRVIDDAWPKNEVYSFSFNIEDSASLKNFYINVRNTTNYKYRNIYFFIHTIFPDGEGYRDTAECYLANKEGKWLGKGMGKIKDNSVLIREGIRFPRKGIYTMEFTQAMREDTLTGITDIGIRIEKIEQ